VLITPFDSIENIAAQRFKLDKKILLLAAQTDEMINSTHFKNLSQASGENSRTVLYPGVGHNTIQTHAEYYNELNQFIDTL